MSGLVCAACGVQWARLGADEASVSRSGTWQSGRVQCVRKGNEDFGMWRPPMPTNEKILFVKENGSSIPIPVGLPGTSLTGKPSVSPPGLGQFRPPPYLPGSSPPPPVSRAEEERLTSLVEQVRERVGTWQERAQAIVELQKKGATAEEVYDSTFVSTIAQTSMVAAAQVYDSLVASQTAEDILNSFDEGKVDTLYALRILSARQRKAAAEFVIQRDLDVPGALELARAIKEHERRPLGREGFTTAPGDCLAFMLHNAATETKDAALKKVFVERALDVVSSDTARARFDAYLPVSSPPPPVSGAEEDETQSRESLLVEQVRKKMGTWQERAQAIVELQKSGVTAEELYHSTFVPTVAQTCMVVAAQVYDSLVSSQTAEDILNSFDDGKVDTLYALRMLSVRQRKAAAEFVIQRDLDGPGAEELARAIKEHERRPAGRKGFTTAPGDCLAFMLHNAATETKDAALKKGFVERALGVVSSDTARARFDALIRETSAEF